MYTSDRFIITNWRGIPKKFIRRDDGSLAVERLQEMKDAGVNLIPVSGYGVGAYDRKTIFEVLTACQKLGLKAQVADERIGKAIQDPEHRRELLEAVVNDYSSYPALMTYYITDEPNANLFPALADVCQILKELDPVHETHINIINNYANEGYWGVPTYEEHIDKYMEIVKPELFSYDYYHFRKGSPVTDDRRYGVFNSEGVLCEKVDSPGFFDNMEDAYRVSKNADIPFMIVILVLEHVTFRYLTEAELRWEVFNSLCYGVI